MLLTEGCLSEEQPKISLGINSYFCLQTFFLVVVNTVLSPDKVIASNRLV